LLERHTDVRVGGREWLKGRWEGGMVSTFEAMYHDVIPNERLVYSYEMHLDDKKISVSLATLQLKAAGGKTTLLVTEQGAFLDGYDDAGSREHGTGELDRLPCLRDRGKCVLWRVPNSSPRYAAICSGSAIICAGVAL
jgi:uncharacterized protein YndB with AHSA1/START domain